MFRIKICGVTNPSDAQMVMEAGADAIGLNFYPGSKRYTSPDEAARICNFLGTGIERVGVFVNESPSTINQVAKALQLTFAQLHGDETPAVLARIDPHVKVIRVYRLGDNGIDAVMADLAACRKAGREPDAILLDAARDGQYGGTGQTVPWGLLVDHRSWLGDLPLVLAGGLVPENVAAAIRMVRPAAVDTASGVESAPQKKDRQRVQGFVSAAESGFLG